MDPEVESALASWEPTVSEHERTDPLWHVYAYRVSRLLLDLSQSDAVLLAPMVEPFRLSQLTRAVASVCANMAEGCSRRTGADRARFYSYALGSCREVMIWCGTVAGVLPTTDLTQRQQILAQLRRLLIGMLKSVQRTGDPQLERG